VRAIAALRDDPARLAKLGANARRAAEQTYDRRHATGRWADIVLATTGSAEAALSLQPQEA
jgi:hypothetical protein